MSNNREVFEEEDGWYYLDRDGEPHGPFLDEGLANAAYARYQASRGNCKTCWED